LKLLAAEHFIPTAKLLRLMRKVALRSSFSKYSFALAPWLGFFCGDLFPETIRHPAKVFRYEQC